MILPQGAPPQSFCERWNQVDETDANTRSIIFYIALRYGPKQTQSLEIIVPLSRSVFWRGGKIMSYLPHAEAKKHIQVTSLRSYFHIKNLLLTTYKLYGPSHILHPLPGSHPSLVCVIWVWPESLCQTFWFQFTSVIISGKFYVAGVGLDSVGGNF